MAQVIWTEPALADLETIADYIALDNPEAARRLVERVFKPIEQLERRPKSGFVPAELGVLDIDRLSNLLAGSFTAPTAGQSILLGNCHGQY